MANPGSGSGPNNQHTEAKPLAIEGWIRIPWGEPDAGHYRPDPSHPIHPYNAELRRRPQVRAWLDSDPGLAQFIESRRDDVQRKISAYRARRGLVSAAAFQEASWFLKQLHADILAIADHLGPKDVDPWIRSYYLMEKLLQPHIHVRNLVLIEPVTLRIDPNGIILMLFTGASQNERNLYTPLIELAQSALGHRKDVGGNRSIAGDPVKNEQARTVAKLRWMGLSTSQIAAFMGWVGSDKAIEKRVKDYFNIGDQLLGEDDPNWPNNRFIPRFNNERHSNIGQPWGEGRLKGGGISTKGE